MSQRMRAVINPMSFIVALVTFILIGSSTVYAQPSHKALLKAGNGAGCSSSGGTSTCSGFASGGASNHVANAAGKGSSQFSGYNGVRWDVFAPDIPFDKCKPTDSEFVSNSHQSNALKQLGLKADFDGQGYIHHRVAVKRDDTEIIIAGSSRGIHYNEDVKINLNNLSTSPLNGMSATQPPNSSTGYVGSKYISNRVCLPLHGGGSFETALTQEHPVIKVANSLGGDSTQQGSSARLALRQKNAKLHVELSQAAIKREAGSIDFRLQNVVLLVCDMSDYYEQIRNNYPPNDFGRLVGCVLSNNVKSPITVNTNSISSSSTSDTITADLKLTLKKKGSYNVALIGIYNANIDIGGTLYNAVAQTAASQYPYNIKVISIKSVGRKH